MSTKGAKTIGIDARFYLEAGPGRYTKAVLQHLERIDRKNKYIVFLRKRGFDEYKPRNSNFTKVLSDFQWYSFAEQTLFLFEVTRRKLDIFYVPHFNIPVLYPGKLVTAIPDLIMHKFSTQGGSTLPKFYFQIKKLVYRFTVWWAVYRSVRIIVPSKDVLNDFLFYYGKTPREKFVVAPEGVDPDLVDFKEPNEKVLSEFGIKTPYILYIGSSYEHKNLRRLVDAFEVLVNKFGFSGQLVIAGKKDTYAKYLSEYIESKKMQNLVIMPGLVREISDFDTFSFRKFAFVYVMPSLKEGFSLTPLESMRLKLPCVISDIPCHREIYADSALYFNADDTADIASKIYSIFINRALREDYVEKGIKKSFEYDWEITARLTLDAFNNI